VLTGGSNNELIGNEVFGAPTTEWSGQPDGIRVEPFTAGTLLQDNFVHDDDDDGIDVLATSARLQGQPGRRQRRLRDRRSSGCDGRRREQRDGQRQPAAVPHVFCQ
jgi:hypothetical protein